MRGSKRLMSDASKSTAGKTVQETVSVENLSKDNTQIIKKTFTVVSESFNMLPPFWRRCIYVYMGAATVSLGVATYNDGKVALMSYRQDRKDAARLNLREEKNEFGAVYKGCRANGWGNFASACVWPKDLFSNIMPSVVLLLNPDHDPRADKPAPAKPAKPTAPPAKG